MPRPRTPSGLIGQAPLLPLAVLVLIGLALDRWFVPWPTTLSLTWGMTCGLAGLLTRRSRWSLVPIALAWLSLAGAWHHVRWSERPPDHLANYDWSTPQPCWLRGQILDPPNYRPGRYGAQGIASPGATRTALRLEAIEDDATWRAVSGKIDLFLDGDRTDLVAGDLVEVAGTLSRIAGPSNPGQFDAQDYQRSRGIELRLSADHNGAWLSVVPARDRWQTAIRGWTRFLGGLRTTSWQRMRQCIPGPAGDLAAAMFLGHRRGIDQDTYEIFARTGMAHLFAMSGLHVTAVTFAVFTLLKLLSYWFDHRLRFRVALVLLGVYLIGVGLTPSIVRATTMAALGCLAVLFWRPASTVNALALAMLVTMAINPAWPFTVGWQLSFLAVGTILGVAGPLARVWLMPSEDPLDRLAIQLEPSPIRILRATVIGIGQAALISAAIAVVTAPLIAHHFHLISPVGIGLNVILVPICSLAVPIAGLAWVLGAIWMPLGQAVGMVAERLIQTVFGLITWADTLPLGWTSTASPPVIWTFTFYVLVMITVFVWVLRGSPRSWLTVALAGWIAVGILWTKIPYRPSDLEVDVLDVGHGLATLLQAPDGSAWLYDCGRLSDPTVGRRVVAPALWSRRIHHLEAIILSHADSDHYNGTLEIVDRFSVGRVLTGPGFASPSNPGAVALVGFLQQRGVVVEPIAAGDGWTLPGGSRIEVLFPESGSPSNGPGPIPSDNDRSLVLAVDHPGGSGMLLTGDLDIGGLVGLTRDRPSMSHRYAVVLAPHHGGRSSNPSWFYDWADPDDVLVSQKWSLAASESRDALAVAREDGRRIWRTWRDGALQVRWRGGQVQVSSFLGDRPTRPKAETIQVALGQKARSSPSASAQGSADQKLSDSSRSSTWEILGWSLACILAATISLAVVGLIVLGLMTMRILTRRRSGMALHEVFEGLDDLEQVELRRPDGTRLIAWWWPHGSSIAPGASQQDRVAVIVHGFADRATAVIDRAEFLVSLGWSVLMPVGRGHGRSGGRWVSFGGREARDLQAWLRWVQRRCSASDVVADGNRLKVDSRPDQWLIWGRSMGAAIALRVAADSSWGCPSDPASDEGFSAKTRLILESPYADLVDATSGWLVRVGVPGSVSRRVARLALILARLQTGRSLRDPRPFELAPRVSCPVLLLHGQEDQLICESAVRGLAHRLAGPSICSTFPQAGHAAVLEADPDGVGEQVAELANLPARPCPDPSGGFQAEAKASPE